jgi:hypothetical protein
MVPMMVPVPSVFVRVTIVAVVVATVVIWPVLLVSGANVDAQALICFGFAGCQSKQSEYCQSEKEIFSHKIVFRFRRKDITSFSAYVWIRLPP